MSSENTLLKLFEREIWLYLDGELSQERKKFWDEKLRQDKELNNFYKSTTSLLENKSESELNNFGSIDFQPFIDIAVSKKQKNRSLRFGRTSSSNFLGREKYKIAFGLTVILIALTLLFTTDKEIPINNLNPDILKWQSQEYSADVEQIEGRILLLEDDQFKNYVIYKLESDQWLKDFNAIHKKITILENKVSTTSF